MAIDKAYASSGKIFEQVSQKTNPGMYEQLQSIEKGEIVVVQGVHDHVEKLLDTLKVPYDIIRMDEVAKYNGGRSMFVNCARFSNVPKNAINAFVEEGGRLTTTDWAIDVVTRSFPGKLKKIGSSHDDVVEVQASSDIGRKLIGLNYSQCHPKWWLEGSSDLYVVKDGTHELITSNEMDEKYGSKDIMIGFPYGKGEVFHFISHLELQRTKQKKNSDKGTLDDFLAKIGAEKTDDMDGATVAELESTYSTLNAVAHLCIKTPLLNSAGMKSYLVGASDGSPKSKKLI